MAEWKGSGMHSPAEEIHVSCIEANCVSRRLPGFAVVEVRLKNTLVRSVAVLGQLPPGDGGLGQVAVYKQQGGPLHCLFLCVLYAYSRRKESGFGILCSWSECWCIWFLESANRVASCCSEIFEAVVNIL